MSTLLNLRAETHKGGATILRDYDAQGNPTGNFVQYRITKDTMKIEGVNVWEEFRRQGLGTELYKEALAKAEGRTVRIDLATEEGARLVRSLVDKGIITTDKAPVKMAEITVTGINLHLRPRSPRTTHMKSSKRKTTRKPKHIAVKGVR